MRTKLTARKSTGPMPPAVKPEKAKATKKPKRVKSVPVAEAIQEAAKPAVEAKTSGNSQQPATPVASKTRGRKAK